MLGLEISNNTSSKLTAREIDIVKGIHACHSNKVIAQDLKLSEEAVKQYIHRIFKKMNFKSRTEVALWVARGLGLLSLLVVSVFGQTPGTVTTASTTSITATTTTVICTLTNSSPAPASGVHTVCKVGANQVLVMDSTIGQATNGVVGSFTNAGDTITWLVNQPSGQTLVSWQMSANGVSKSGTF